MIRLRTNFRKGEDVYLYRTTLDAAAARDRFQDYLSALNHLHEHPVWYNALTTNCTTSIRIQHRPDRRQPWDWRMLVNGKGDEMMFERGLLATGGLSFAELKQRSHINSLAQQHGNTADFSAHIRAALPSRK